MAWNAERLAIREAAGSILTLGSHVVSFPIAVPREGTRATSPLVGSSGLASMLTGAFASAARTSEDFVSNRFREWHISVAFLPQKRGT